MSIPMHVRCAYREMMRVSDLVPHPKNPKPHSKEQVERLAKVIAHQGWRRPIRISTRSGFITAGHGALLAAKKNKWDLVPVDAQDYESEELEIQDIIADNALSLWEEMDMKGVEAMVTDLGPFDLELLGFKDFKIDVSELGGGGLTDEDEVPETPKEAKAKPGDLWILGNHRLLCGDCTVKENVERLMAGEKADMVFTSPPYSDQRDYSGGLDLSVEKLSGIFDWQSELFVVNLGYQRKNNQVNRYWDEWISQSEKKGNKLLSWNIWDRSGFGYTVGQATAMFTIDHEWIFVFGKKPIELNKTIENKQSGVSKSGTQRQKNGETTAVWTTTASKRQMGTVIRMDVARYVGDDHTHPAMFPVALPESYIEAIPCKIVADPFLGSGSTFIACEKTGRRCFGMEIDPHYCDVILARWAKYTGKDPVREDGVKWSELKN